MPERHLEDLIHDVFVVVHNRLDTFDSTRPIKPWLFGIAYRVGGDFWKRAATQREQLDRPSHEPAIEPEAEEAVAARQAQALVHRALEALSDEQRAVFILHEIDGEPIPAVADALGIPLNTAYSRLRLGRARFVERIRELDPEMEAGHV